MGTFKGTLFFSFAFLFLLPNQAKSQFDSLFVYYRTLSIQAQQDVNKTHYSDSLRGVVKEFLDTENSFKSPIINVPYLGDLFSPDNAFRLITWNISLKDGSYDYICFIQTKPDQNGDSQWFELNDNHKRISRAESRSLNKDNWYGCLYYTIIPFKKDKELHYALLGWEGHNNYSNKKIIECLTFNKKQEPEFSSTVFKTDRLNKRRVIFEYSKEAYMMLRYNEDLKQIIFNRLEPTKEELTGVYSFYQPTMTFDAYQYKKSEWVIIEDVNPRNKKNDKEFHNPEDLKKPKK